MPQRIDLKLCHLLLWWIGECSKVLNLLVASAAASLSCRNKFEGILEALSQFETREAQVLMTEALEAMDMMNNAIILQNEVLRAPSDEMCIPIRAETLRHSRVWLLWCKQPSSRRFVQSPPLLFPYACLRSSSNAALPNSHIHARQSLASITIGWWWRRRACQTTSPLE